MLVRRGVLAGSIAASAIARLAGAQAPRRPLVAVLVASSHAGALGGPILPNFLAGLGEQGLEPGRNVHLEMRFADGVLSRLPELARTLAAMNPDVIYTSGTPGAHAAMSAAPDGVPIVVGPAAEITMSALVPNYARPDRNVTGLTLEAPEQDAKCIEYFKSCLPRANRFAILTNAENPVFRGFVDAMARATATLGVHLFEVAARGRDDLARVMGDAIAGGADGIIVANDGILVGDQGNRRRIIDSALQARLPSASTSEDFVRDGGLLALSVDTAALARRSAWFVARILRGARPSELPVERPPRVVLGVNLRTARDIGIDLPPVLLARADLVID